MSEQYRFWRLPHEWLIGRELDQYVDGAFIKGWAGGAERATGALECLSVNDPGKAVLPLNYIGKLVVVGGKVTGFCDVAGPGDESVLAVCEGNAVRIVDSWHLRDTMHSVGKFLVLFRKLRLRSYEIGGDEGYGHQLMDRMAEEGYYLRRINNGSPASKANLYANLGAEWWSVVGELIERRQIGLPPDEKLVAQLTSRQKLYDSKGREKLESKADMRARGLESPDRADAVIGAAVMSLPGFTGGISMETLAGIQFGSPQGGRALFDFEPLTFD